MKKYFSLLICALVSLFVFNVSASAKTVITNLPEAVKEEIEYFGNSANFEKAETFEAYQEYVNTLKSADLSNYSESDSKINIYIFRGSSCWHCLDEITWLADNYDLIAEYANVHTFEVWGNKNNSKLMSLVAKQLGTTANGVPFTVVGDKTFGGFSEEIGSQIVEKVKELYNSEEKKDIKDTIDLNEVTLIGENKKSSNTVMLILITAVLIGGIVLIYLISKSK